MDPTVIRNPVWRLWVRYSLRNLLEAHAISEFCDFWLASAVFSIPAHPDPVSGILNCRWIGAGTLLPYECQIHTLHLSLGVGGKASVQGACLQRTGGCAASLLCPGSPEYLGRPGWLCRHCQPICRRGQSHGPHPTQNIPGPYRPQSASLVGPHFSMIPQHLLIPVHSS